MVKKFKKKLFAVLSVSLFASGISFAIKQMVFSPLSFKASLVMATNCTTDEKAINGVAEYLNVKDLYSANCWLSSIMNGKIDGVDIANSMWCVIDNLGRLKNTFKELKKNFNKNFKASYAFINLENGCKKINSWISEKTNGKIPNAVDSLDSETALILLNTVYFKSEFVDKFEVGDKMSFYGVDKTTSGVPTIEDVRDCDYCETNYYRAIRIPFENGCYLYMILPKSNKYLDKFENLDIKPLKSNMKSKFTSIQMPRFKIESSLHLKDYCEANNFLNPLMDATLDKISSLAKIGKIEQKAFFEISPNGVEAGAVTVNDIVNENYREEKVSIVFNRPFIALITDQKDNILFRANIKRIDVVESVVNDSTNNIATDSDEEIEKEYLVAVAKTEE